MGSINGAHFGDTRMQLKDVHKEYVMRWRFNSILAPSKDLLTAWREKTISWQEYAQKYRAEILNNPSAIKRIKELIEISKTKDVYLITAETPAKKSHRDILLNIINELKKEQSTSS